MARSRDSRRRRGRRGGQPRAASAATPRPTRQRAPRPEVEAPAPGDAIDGSGGVAEAAALPARPRREIGASRPTTSDAPRVQSLFYRLTHPRAILAIIDELRKVVWPSRQETANLTVVVLVVAIAVGIFLGAIDFGLNRVVEETLLP